MHVIVHHHYDDSFNFDHEGTRAEIEIYLRRAFPFLNEQVPVGDLDRCLLTIDGLQACSVELDEDSDRELADRVMLREQEEDPAAQSRMAKAMQGVRGHLDAHLEQAEFLSGGTYVPDQQNEVLAKREDPVFAALAAYGIAQTEENAAALRAVSGMGDLAKGEPGPLPVPKSISPAYPDAREAADAIQSAYEDGAVQIVKLNGKHSKGAAIARDPHTDRLYLLKPGAGGTSPAKGVKEEPASQSRREAGFWHVADWMGLGGYMPRVDLLFIDDKEVAAIQMLPFSFQNLGDALKEHLSYVPGCFTPYLQKGVLHQWATMDYVLGNPDRHYQNIMVEVGTETVRLIDHGSAFAGESFDPAHDKNSFIPYYLRAWTGRRFSDMTPEDQYRQMPSAGILGGDVVGSWLAQLNPDILASKLKMCGLRSDACVGRLKRIKSAQGPKDAVINGLWIGFDPKDR